MSRSQWFESTTGGERLHQERPDDQAVRDPDRSAGPQAEGQRADPEHEHGRRRDVQAGLRRGRRRRCPRAGSSLRPMRRCRRARSRRRRDPTPTPSRTTSHRRAGDRPDEQVVQVPRRLLVADRRDLAGDRDRDQTGRDHEHEPQVRSRPGAAPAQPLDHAVEAGRPLEGAPRRLRDQAEDQTDHGEHAHPGDDRGPREAKRQAGLAAQQERSRPGRVAAGERARAQIPSLRHPDRDDRQHHDQRDDRGRTRTAENR